ncbi:MAG: hypothetical protein ACK4SU_02065, partial [Dictyoglomus sp.]
MNSKIFKRIGLTFIFLFLVPFLIFLGVEYNSLKNEIIYPILYQLSITIALGIAIYCFLSIERKWKGWIGWFFVVLGLIFLFIGDTVWNYYAIFFKKEASFPGISDFFYVMFYILAFIFLLYFIRLLNINFATSEKIMISIIGLIFVILLFQGVLLPILATKDMDLFSKILHIFYIVGDFILVLFAFMIIIGIWGGKVAKSYSYFIIGIALMGVSDIAFTYVLKNYG